MGVFRTPKHGSATSHDGSGPAALTVAKQGAKASMIVTRRVIASSCLGAGLLFAGVRAARAEGFDVLCTNALKAVMEALTPAMEKALGQAPAVTFGGANRLRTRIEAGDRFDVAVLTPALIEELEGKGKIAKGTASIVARAGLGVSVRKGAPRPQIGTMADFREALLKASSIAYSPSGLSGEAFGGVLDRLGIASEVRPKTRPATASPAAELVAQGEAELAVQLIPELIAVPGAELVGPFPAELQSYVVLAAAVGAQATDPARARALIKFLASPQAVAVIREKGLEPR
jgi:molybdate transport system substrate-binding protein